MIDFWVLVAISLFVILFCYIYSKATVSSVKNTPSLCDNQSCARCRSKKRFEKDALLHKLNEQIINSRDIEHTLRQVITYSLDHQEDIRRDTYILSGYDDESEKEPVIIWMLPGLTRQSFWYKNDHVLLNRVDSLLQNETIIDDLVKEYTRIKDDDRLWSVNQTPKGKWSVLALINQGTLINETCEKCPVAFEIIKKLTRCMIGNMFCYAMYSSLEPGSIIEPHTGPCNFRIRCHVPLITPKGFRLHVGKKSIEWKRGRLIMFDDSLIHSVISDSNDCVDNRVVFIIDIWHPEVNQDIQKGLNTLFESENNF